MNLPAGQAPQLQYDASGHLCLQGLRLDDLAAQYGTPLFVYAADAMRDALGAWQRGVQGRNARICYAVKANSALAVLQWMARAGCGFDIVSGGELARVLAAGGDAAAVVFSGAGKTRADMQAALQAGVGCFNVESLAELHTLSAVAQGMGLRAPVSIRVNPDVDARTHPYISTGLKDNKFGIAHKQALDAYRLAASLPGLRVVGIDVHIGSQITQTAPFADACARLCDMVQRIEAEGIALEHIDLGGGLGIAYRGDEAPPGADALCAQIFEVLDAHGLGQRRVLFEPGRSIVGVAGVCVTEVLNIKEGETRNFCIVDAAMNDLPRPAMYQAYHPIVPLRAGNGAAQAQYDVVGPVCESGDWLGRERTLAVQAGDRLAVLCAGAYCASMASNYNARARAAEVLIDDGAAHLIVQRETPQALFARERLLP